MNSLSYSPAAVEMLFAKPSSPMNSASDSPTTVDMPLDYITVDSYEWPQEPARAKRLRLESEERKRRHRDDQKRFMQRKRARLNEFRQEAALKELQVNYLRAVREEMKLRDERKRLDELHSIQQNARQQNIKKEFPFTFSVPTEEFAVSFSVPTEEPAFPCASKDISFPCSGSPLPLGETDAIGPHPEFDSFFADVLFAL